jgi:hypothetical protein
MDFLSKNMFFLSLAHFFGKNSKQYVDGSSFERHLQRPHPAGTTIGGRFTGRNGFHPLRLEATTLRLHQWNESDFFTSHYS